MQLSVANNDPNACFSLLKWREIVDAVTAELLTLGTGSGDIRVFTNNFIPNPANVYADFVEPTFTGYGPVTLAGAFPASTYDGNGAEAPAFNTATFKATADPLAPVTIYGWMLTNAAVSPVVLASGAFETPIVIGKSGDGFTLALSIFLSTLQPQP